MANLRMRSTYSVPATRQNIRRASPSLIGRVLQSAFGPTARVQKLEEYGLKGARVTTRENGQTFVHAQLFMSGTDEQRVAAVALRALDGLS